MGVFDFFKRRRQRERALPQALPLSGGFARGEEGNGNSHVDMASRTVDLRDTAAREELLELMHDRGVDPQPDSAELIDAASVPGLQQAIIDELERHGVDVGEPGAVDHDDWEGESRRN